MRFLGGRPQVSISEPVIFTTKQSDYGILFEGKIWDLSCSQSRGGGGALRCFRYRVCAAGQGIVFIILAPEQGIVFCKNAPKRVYSFKIFAPRQDYSVFSWSFAPRQGVVFCKFAPRRGYLNWGKCSQTGWKSHHLKGTHPYILGPSAPPPPGFTVQ